MPNAYLSMINRVPGVGMTPYGSPTSGPMAPVPQGNIRPALGAVPVRQKPGFLQRLLPVPGAMAGLLGDGDAHQARTNALLALGSSLLEASQPVVGGPAPSLGAALGRGLTSGMGTFEQSLNNSAQRNVQSLQTMQGLRDQQAKLAFRDRVAGIDWTRLSPEQRNATWQQLAGEASAAGMDIGSISQMVNATKPPEPKPLEKVERGNKVSMVDPMTGREVTSYGVGPKPVDPETASMRQAMMGTLLDSRKLRSSQMYANSINNDKTYATATQGMAAVRLTRTYVAAARAGDPQAQMDLVGNAIKAQHPTAVIRPGEIARTEDGRPIADEIGAFWQRLSTGGHLTQGQVDHIAHMTEQLYDQHATTAKTRLNQARQYMDRHGLYSDILFDPEDIGQTHDYRTGAVGGAGDAGRVDALLGGGH